MEVQMPDMNEGNRTRGDSVLVADNSFTPVWEMFIHVMVGTSLFLVFGIPAVLLNLVIEQLKVWRIDPWILNGLTLCEYVLFGVGVVLFITFSIRTAWKAITRIW
jgi:hypothetical protein